jgi:hypothetical protein
MPKSYKVRRFQNGKNSQGKPFYNHSLTIPSEIAEQLPEDMRFEIELLEDIPLPDNAPIPEEYRGRTLRGLLFVPVSADRQRLELPSWANEAQELRGMMDGGVEGAKPQRQPRRRPGSKA